MPLGYGRKHLEETLCANSVRAEPAFGIEPEATGALPTAALLHPIELNITETVSSAQFDNTDRDVPSKLVPFARFGPKGFE